MNIGSTHFDQQGNAHLVDVSQKAITVRRATAQAVVSMKKTTSLQISSGDIQKGDVLAIARIAAIQATKLTQQLIPLCHAIPIESVSVQFSWPQPHQDQTNSKLLCEVSVGTTAKTGVEMEAMTAVSVACLTIYDMVKSIDRECQIGPIRLVQKSGGKSGDFSAETEEGR